MRNKVLHGREQYAKEAIKFYYKLAKINGLVEELLESSGLKNEDSLRWSYNKGRISIEQINAYKYVLGVDGKYLIGEKELTEKVKSEEMKRIRAITHDNNESSSVNRVEKENKIIRARDIVDFYKNQILSSKNSFDRDVIKQQLEQFSKEINESIEHLNDLIKTLNAMDD